MSASGIQANFQNRTLYHGDNLAFLRGMNSETVHLIATDPPFNKNRDFHATPDTLAAGAKFKDRWRWEVDVREGWIDRIKDDWSRVNGVVAGARLARGDEMGAFLCWLGVRLMEMRRVLRRDGSIYVHCDPTASHYLKALMDAIFGWKNFRNEIVWHYQTGGASQRHYARKHDTILFYAKSANHVFNASAVRVPRSEKSIKRAQNPKGARIAASDRDKLATDVWTDLPSLNPMARERTGYPTQKPLALYERIIQASSNEGDFVLDPFCGCATTPIAAERLKRRWVGMDIWDGALDVVKERFRRDTILRSDDEHHVGVPRIHYETKPPRRSDANELPAPGLKLRAKRPTEAWQKLTHRQMKRFLEWAQRSKGKVICAGCGRELEREFMELDHIRPRADGGENHIRNRILLCRPCKGRKAQRLTLRGLLRANKKAKWMNDAGLAQLARENAQEKADWLSANFDAPECQSLIEIK